MIKRMVITGASGFLGRKLHEMALKQGWEVLCINRHASSDSVSFDAPNLETYLSDFAPRVIVHLAASYGNEASGPGLHANLLLPVRLLQWAANKNKIRFIAAGSFWQMGDISNPGPVDVYSASKQSLAVFLDYYRRCQHVDCYQLILSSSYGPSDPRGKLIDYLADSAKLGKTATLGNQDKQFALTDVRDIANAIMLLASSKEALSQLTYKVRSDELWSFDRLISLFAQLGYPLLTSHPLSNKSMIEIVRPNDGHLPTLPGWTSRYHLADYLCERLSISNTRRRTDAHS